MTFALTPTEKLNLIGSADNIFTGKVLAETISYPLRTETPVKNISIKVADQLKGGCKSLVDVVVSDSETSLKVGTKYLFFLKYSLVYKNMVPLQKANWYIIEGAEYLLLIDLVKKYPISIDITNPESTLLYDKKNQIKCKVFKTKDGKVEISNVRLNIIYSSDTRSSVNENGAALIAIEKVVPIKLTESTTNFDIPVKLRNSENKDDYQVVIQPIFLLKINVIPCEYYGAIPAYYISNKDL